MILAVAALTISAMGSTPAMSTANATSAAPIASTASADTSLLFPDGSYEPGTTITLDADLA